MYFLQRFVESNMGFFLILPFFWLYSHKENILDGKNNCLQAFASSGQTMFLIFVNVDSVVCMPSRQALKEKTITHNMSIMSYLSYEELKTHLTWLNIGGLEKSF